MLKRFLFFAVLILSAATLLTSCGGKKEAKDAKPADTGKTYTLNLNCTYPPPKYEWESKYIANDKFAKRVEEATNGRVKVKVFYNNQLAPQSQGLDALKKDVIQLESATAYWGGTIPETEFVFLPFWSKGHAHAMHVVRETKIGEIMDKAYQKHGAKILFYWPVSIEGLITKKPVAKFEDIKGMKIRTASSLWPSWYQKMGVAPINIAANEQYEALMRGTMDGSIYVLYSIDTYKFYEVAKNITLPGFVDPFLCYVLVSTKTWDSLPDDLKKTIEQVALEIEKESVKGSERLTDSILELCNQHGVTVNKLTKQEFEKFRQSAMPLWDEFAAKSPDCAEMVRIIKEDLKKWEETNPDSKQWEERWLAKS
ncbi:MAG: TRAP transporter substrate-binding protein [Peptococcaceae bacterium]|nr:TRAP transporter substrate-binding protein [Peptococcaceae bacterium]